MATLSLDGVISMLLSINTVDGLFNVFNLLSLSGLKIVEKYREDFVKYMYFVNTYIFSQLYECKMYTFKMYSFITLKKIEENYHYFNPRFSFI